MKAWEIVVLIICVLFVVAVIVKTIIDKINGKCSCGCDNCKMKGQCQKNKKEKKMEKYLKCEGCGAIVKVIKDCTCANCGINCCGKQMVEYIPTENEKGTGEIITCAKCGAQVEIVVPCTCANCGIICCGEQMK